MSSSGQAELAYVYGADNTPQTSSLDGDFNVSATFRGLKVPKRLRITSNPDGTPFENVPCAAVIVVNDIDNDVIFVGGVGDDTPYMDNNYAGDHRGWPIWPGGNHVFEVSNANLLNVIGTTQDDVYYGCYVNQPTDITTDQTPLPAPDYTAPTISSVTPTNGATGVATNADIVATMSEAIDSGTVNTTNVTISPSVAYTTFLDTVNPAKIVVKPTSNLGFTTAYTITLKVGLADLVGNNLAAQYTWSFTTAGAPPPPDTTPPTISSKNPAAGATGVLTSVTPQVVFSESMKTSTINTTNIFLTDDTGASVASTVALGGDLKTVTLTPNTTLLNSKVYTMHVTTGVQDLAGNALASTQTWTFTTTAPYTLIYNGSGSNLQAIYNGVLTPWAWGEYVVNTSSVLYNKIIKKVIVNLSKTGSPSGNANIKIYNASGGLVRTMGSIPTSSITTSVVSYTITDDTNTVALVVGYSIMVEYQAGDASNCINVQFNQNGNPVDGGNSVIASQGQVFGYPSSDAGSDLAGQLYT